MGVSFVSIYSSLSAVVALIPVRRRLSIATLATVTGLNCNRL